ncbi:hypothetical protein V1227_21525 [Lentzea sp. DG1S-22]|uniref:hypothetical protein n=1 Tax=Lentzea sp. DG1S-22 TaxID=3108822 RepID=UPI002E7635D4|nr:hypothetical protein [Lentzea sp. DG1S-22]WVH77690.1 hypothetical protein V1227_21525 [Lentzea sp. DG1S-22]
MRAKGIAYDTGFVRHGEISLEGFDLDVVRRDLTVIRDDLRCNAVHLVGGDPERLELAAGIAAGLGLEIWFSPYPLELTPDGILELFTDCARRAERVRLRGAEVVFVTGVEVSIMNSGFLPGDDVGQRLGHLLGRPERMREAGEKLTAFLAEAVAVVRQHFREAHLRLHPVREPRLGPVRHQVVRADPLRRGRRRLRREHQERGGAGETGRDHRLRHGGLARLGCRGSAQHGDRRARRRRVAGSREGRVRA